MNGKSIGLTFVSCGVALLLYGCATVDQKPFSGSNSDCAWTFDRESDGKLKMGSLKAESKGAKACTVQESKSFLIGDKDNDWLATVTTSSAAEFTAVQKNPAPKQGESLLLCRICWPNGSGGVSCVYYPC
jgi:hypothetical protein